MVAIFKGVRDESPQTLHQMRLFLGRSAFLVEQETSPQIKLI